MIWLVRRKAARAVVIASTVEEVRGHPLFSNWRDLLAGGYWDPSEGQQYKVSLLGTCSDDSQPDGPIIFENC